MRHPITALGFLLTPVTAIAHNGSHSGLQGIEALTHQLLQHAPALMAGITLVALGYAFVRRRSHRHAPSKGNHQTASMRNLRR